MIVVDRPTAADIEVASWQLAATVLRRQPQLRLLRGFPGGGQYDVLWLLGRDGDPCDIRLNRNGTIQVWGRSSAGPGGEWPPAGWAEYLAGDREEFALRLQSAAGLVPRRRALPPVPHTVVVGVLAAIAERVARGMRRVDVQLGYIDTSGYGGGPNPAFAAFDIDRSLLAARADDLFGEAGYRFWIVFVEGLPVLALETSQALAWRVPGGHHLDVMQVFAENGRRHQQVAAALLGWAEVQL